MLATSTMIQENGKRSGNIALSSSVRQGYLLSPLYYAFVLEPLLRRLKNRTFWPALRGIALPGGA